MNQHSGGYRSCPVPITRARRWAAFPLGHRGAIRMADRECLDANCLAEHPLPAAARRLPGARGRSRRPRPSPEELRQFWNLRASGKRVSFLPEGDAQQRLVGYTRTFLERLPPQQPQELWGTLWRARAWTQGEELDARVASLIPDGMVVIRGAAGDEAASADELGYGNFASDLRGRITPAQAGLYTFGGGSRRVPGLRREEVASLSGVSVAYYTKLERGDTSGVSDTVLEGPLTSAATRRRRARPSVRPRARAAARRANTPPPPGATDNPVRRAAAPRPDRRTGLHP